jgi:transketolase
MDYLVKNFKNESELDKKATREAFGLAIVSVANENDDVVVLNADLPGSLKLQDFIEVFPERYLQIGVAEQNMASIAVGLSHYGKIPFITSYAAFSPGLNIAQIRTGAIKNQNFKIVSSHYGLNIGPDGASAQMESDIAMMKAIPNMVIVNPADFNQTKTMTHLISRTKGPAYLRLTREKFPVFLQENAHTEIGKVQKLLSGDKLTVIATGSMVYETLQAILEADKDGGNIELLNLHTIKPLDNEGILSSVKKTGKLLIVEEHNIWGGVGESISRIVAENYPVMTKIIGIDDTFGESGEHRRLWEKYGLDRKKIALHLHDLLNRN